jgi:glycosyltransferase involved in cell wall biosynthesis
MSTIASAAARKIIFVNRYFFPDRSATSQMLSDLAFGLVQRGLSVHVVCSRQRYDQAQANLAATEIVGGVTVHRVWTTSFGRPRLAGRAVDYASFYVSSAVRLLLLVSRGDILVAETDPPLISIVAAAVAASKGARLMNWLHDVFPEVATLLGVNPLPSRLGRWLLRLRDLSLHAAVSNVVLGTRMRDLLRHRVPASKLCVIENWAAAETAGAKDAPSELRTRLGLADKFVVGYSGNLGRAHDFETLLEAASACGSDPDIVFLMIGAGAGMTALQRAVLYRGLANFRFLPLQPREVLADTMAAADVHWLSLLPSLEGLIVPSKLYGILAAGRPVLFIGDPDGEVARIIGPARAGLSVPIGQAAALARSIAQLKTDRAFRRKMAENAHRLYREKYTGQIALDRWMELLGRTDGDTERLIPESLAAGVGIRPLSSR